MSLVAEGEGKGIKRYKLPVIKQRSHRDEKYSTGNIVSRIVTGCMVTEGDYIYCGEHFIMYRIVESICCTPETNIVCQVHFNK